MATWVKVGNIKGPAGPPGSAGGGPATSTTLGGIKLAGDLAGTADAPTVPALAGKYTLPSGGIPITDLDSGTRSTITSAVQPAALTSGLATKANSSHTHAEADVTGLITDLAGKAALSHTHAQSDVTGLGAALAAKADLIGGLIPQAQLPAVALTDFLGAVATQSAMLALTGQRGDWAIRTDLGTTWVLIADDPTQLSSWHEHAYPASPVQSVAGRTGAVTLSKTDVGLTNVDNTSDVNKPVSTAQAAAIAAKYSLPVGGIPEADLSTSAQSDLALARSALQSAPVTSVAGRTGVVTLAKADVGLGNVDNTADVDKPISTAVGGALTNPRTALPLSYWDGAVAASYDPSNTNQGTSGNSQQGCVIWLPGPHTYTEIFTYVRTAGNHGTGSADLNGFRVWNAAGTAVLSTTTPSSPTTLWETAGKVSLPLDSQIVVPAAGLYIAAEWSTHGYDTPPSMHYQVMANSSALSAVGGPAVPRSWGAFRSAWPTANGGALASIIDGGGYVPLILLK
jgi:hypothetical protein